MKKNIILIAALLVLVLSVNAQKRKKGTEVSCKMTELEMQKKIYKKSLQYGDVTMMQQSLFHLIIADADSVNYMKSLAQIYLSTGQNHSAAQTSKYVMKYLPNDTLMTELLAIALQNQGNAKEAIETYTKLLKMKESSYYAFNLAKLQFGIKRFSEAHASINIAESLPSNDTYVRVETIKENEMQNVKLSAAIANLKGLIEYEMGEEYIIPAMKSFEKAVKIDPGFVLAKQNIKSLQAIIEQKESGAPAGVPGGAPADITN